MPAISRLIAVAQPGDMLESLRFAFERDGTEIALYGGIDGPDKLAEMLAERDGDETVRGHDVIIANSGSSDEATALLGKLRAVIKNAPVRMPIVYLGNELSVDAGIAAGANAVLSQPLFVRDVVVATGLVARRRRADLARGDLKDFDGLFYIVRALTQFKRSAVLTVVRGLRRGEIRFFEGQATSAQIGALHGLSALHHLMLWRVGTFELRFESVVQRQQIPLATDDLLSDVRRFLAEVQETAQSLLFVGSYETVDKRVADVTIPNEIREVLDLMDGSRTLPDIVEDSPYRMFETLRIANRLFEHKLIRHITEISSDFGFKMRRRVEEMVLSPNSPVPIAVTGDETGRTVKLNRNHVPETDVPDESAQGKRIIDWSDVIPASPSSEDKLAQVVPASVAAGEITVAGEDGQAAEAAPEGSRAARGGAQGDAEGGEGGKPRPEQLETFTNAEERDQLFALGESPASERQGRSASGEDRAADEAERASPAGEPDGTPDGESAEEQSTAKVARLADDRHALRKSRSENQERGEGKVVGEHFSDDEEAFFQAGREIEKREPPKVESFDDLDEGYEPVSFWQRLFGRRSRSGRGRSASASRDSKAADGAPRKPEGSAPKPARERQSSSASGAATKGGEAERGEQGKKSDEARPASAVAAETADTKSGKEAADAKADTSASDSAIGGDARRDELKSAKSGQSADECNDSDEADKPSPNRSHKRRATTKSDGKKRKKRKKRKKH